MPTLGVVPDLVVSSQADPLRQRPVDPLFLGQDALDLKGLVRRLRQNAKKRGKTKSVATPSNKVGTPPRTPARGRETNETKRAARARERERFQVALVLSPLHQRWPEGRGSVLLAWRDLLDSKVSSARARELGRERGGTVSAPTTQHGTPRAVPRKRTSKAQPRVRDLASRRLPSLLFSIAAPLFFVRSRSYHGVRSLCFVCEPELFFSPPAFRAAARNEEVQI